MLRQRRGRRCNKTVDVLSCSQRKKPPDALCAVHRVAPDHANSANLQRGRFRRQGRFVAKTRLRLFATRRTGTRPLFLPEFRGGSVARAIDPDQSVKPGYKNGMAPSKRCCFFGMVTPNPHARQSPSGLKSNCKPDRRRGLQWGCQAARC
jgi:hypothetical protein